MREYTSSASAAVPVVVVVEFDDVGLDDRFNVRGRMRGIGGNGFRPLLLGLDKNLRAPPIRKIE